MLIMCFLWTLKTVHLLLPSPMVFDCLPLRELLAAVDGFLLLLHLGVVATLPLTSILQNLFPNIYGKL